MMIIDGRLARVDVNSEEMATQDGLKVGDDEEAVLRTFGMVWRTPHHYTDGKYLLEHSENGKTALLFETDNQKITECRVGTVAAVQYVEGCD